MKRRVMDPAGEWWVDDRGEWRGAHISGQFPALSFGETQRDEESAAFFFLGMANIITHPYRIRVRWSVRHVDTESLAAVVEFLDALEAPPRIVLEYYFGGWERKIFNDKVLAIEWLENAMRYRHALPMIKPYVRMMSVDDRDAALPTMRAAFAAWDRSRGQFSLSRENALSPLNRRFLVSGPRESDGGLVYRYMGAQAPLTRFKGAEWASRVMGKLNGKGVINESHCDLITGPYDEVLRSNQPRFDHVRACITRDDKIPEWVTYQRLLLPAESDSGAPLVLCLVIKTSRINIPHQAQTA